jgi:Domain of unknown function (DU1801).
MSTRPSDTAKVDAYMGKLVHPLSDVLQALRQVILAAQPEVGEEIKWNAPTFFFAGEMADSDPKEYKRYLIVSNLFQKDCIRLVFWQGGRVNDNSGFLEGDYKDGRRLAKFCSVLDVEAKKDRLMEIVREQIRLLNA